MLTAKNSPSTLWSALGIKEDMTKAYRLSPRLLEEENPYAGIKELPTLPTEQELISQSSLLGVRPDLSTKSYAGEIALAEFTHYMSQTYYFEVLGFQIIGATAAGTTSFAHVHDLASQALDEARHMQIYLGILKELPFRAGAAPCIPKMFKSIVENGSLEEKLVKGFLILESQAIGLFAARSKIYNNCGLTRLDQLILREETQHQNNAKSFASLLIREEKLSYQTIFEIMREGVRELSFDVLPLPVAKVHGIDLDRRALERLQSTGLTGHQTAVSRSNLRKVLTDLRAVAKTDKRVPAYA